MAASCNNVSTSVIAVPLHTYVHMSCYASRQGELLSCMPGSILLKALLPSITKMAQGHLLLAIILLLGAFAAVSGNRCTLEGPRADCGYLGIAESECLARSCCWNPTSDGLPWCHMPISEDDQCDDEGIRSDCGEN